MYEFETFQLQTKEILKNIKQLTVNKKYNECITNFDNN